MEKGLARFRVSLLCFVAAGFVAAGLLRLVCCCLLRLLCCAEVADSSRRSFPLRGSLPFSGANAACNCLPPQRCRYSNRVLVLCLFGSQCRLQLSATLAPRELQPRPGPVPNRVANAACNCLPPQRCRHSNRVLAQCPVGSQCLLRLSATSAPPVLPPRPGPVPF